MTNPVFHRPQLATEVANLALGRNALGRAGAGVFLAAPRRTGKTTFLLQDLTPALRSEGVHVIYVDLWANKEVPPSELIANAIARDLSETQGAAAKIASAIKAVTIHGVSFDLHEVGKKAGATLAEALRELQATLGRPIALIVDEAQHVVAEGKSMDAMFALKSARDTLNVDGTRKLLLIMSGSDRDKLLRLVNTPSAPFFGAQIHDLPPLGRDYAAHVAGRLVQAHSRLTISNDALDVAFDRFVRRPEPFEEAIGLAANPLAGPDANFHERLAAEADKYERMLDQEHEEVFAALSPLEAAVLRWVLEHGPGARLFTQDALAYYGGVIGKAVGAGSARDAVQSLRNIEPPVLWKSDRGDYALENTDMLRWYRKRKDAGLWPPGG